MEKTPGSSSYSLPPAFRWLSKPLLLTALHLPALLAWARKKACLRANTAKPLKSEEHTMSKFTAATTTKPTATKPNIYQAVNDRIISSLKDGIIPWEKPGKAPTYAGGSFSRNFRTGKPYHGVNVFLLWSMPYIAPFWLTFKQAQELGGTARKGKKGTQIVSASSRERLIRPPPSQARKFQLPVA